MVHPNSPGSHRTTAAEAAHAAMVFLARAGIVAALSFSILIAASFGDAHAAADAISAPVTHE